MKLAANLSTQFNHGDWPSRVRAAAAEGFRAVEMQWPYSDVEASELRAALGQHGIEAILVNAPVGNAPETAFGYASRANDTSSFLSSILKVVDRWRSNSGGLNL